MLKITPDPPSTEDLSLEQLTPSDAAHLAQTHFQNHALPGEKLVNRLPESLFVARPDLSAEEALTTAYEVLESAIATASRSAENQDGSNRQLTLAIVYLMEVAHALVNSVVDSRWVATEAGLRGAKAE